MRFNFLAYLKFFPRYATKKGCAKKEYFTRGQFLCDILKKQDMHDTNFKNDWNFIMKTLKIYEKFNKNFKIYRIINNIYRILKFIN